jgi:hypothetical protein
VTAANPPAALELVTEIGRALGIDFLPSESQLAARMIAAKVKPLADVVRFIEGSAIRDTIKGPEIRAAIKPWLPPTGDGK